MVVMVGCSSLNPELRKRPLEYMRAVEAVPLENASSGDLAEGATLDDYLRYAAFHNPGLEASYYEWMAALEKVPQAEALPDPRLSYGYYFQEVETRVGSQRQRLGASQMFPWLGKLNLRGDIAARAAEEARQRFEAKKLRLFYRVKDAYAEYYYLGRAIEITRENVELLTYWEELTRAKYRVATGGHADVIKIQAELGKLEDRLSTLEDLRRPLAMRLNETLGREGNELLPWPKSLRQEFVVLEDEDLLEEMSRSNPELKALDAAIAKEEHRIDLAAKEYFPDVTFGVQWIDTTDIAGQELADNGKDPLIGTVSVTVPLWWQKYSAGVREARAGRHAALKRRTDRELELSTALELALYGFRDAERKVDPYGDGLIPNAREVLAANMTADESGDADVLDLLDNRNAPGQVACEAGVVERRE
jgi:outer membrane protein TolC